MLGGMPRRTATVLAGIVALLVTAVAPAHATVSILAVDPATGQVGVAAASCVSYDLARIVTLVPGKGVAVTQGRQRRADPLRLMRAMRSGASAQAVLDRVAGPTSGQDPRQYAVVTADGAVAERTGAAAPATVGDVSYPSMVVVGNDLMRREVADRAGRAFEAATGSLADRLLAALRASSVAGGDRRCGSQTATAALLIVAGPDRKPLVPSRGLAGVRARRAAVFKMVGKTIAADQVSDLLLEAAALKRPTGPGRPDLYLSLIQPEFGFNAVELLGQAYRQLRSSPSPTPAATPAPTGGSASATASKGPSIAERAGWVVAWVALGLVALAAWWTPRRRGRRRAQDDVDEVGASRSGT
jgi:uncharacterized Ntn-hydrolase superfamily protein